MMRCQDGLILYTDLIKVSTINNNNNYCSIKIGQRVLNEFKVVSITFDTIIVSWDVYPKENATLTLSITDSYQTVNNIINVTGYDNVYNYTGDIHLCDVYTFKLMLPKIYTGCNDNIRMIYTGTI